ncbi:MAG: DNA-binding response regulator [Flavobacteriales bacterium CG18_big_fil_WC_8_21_14_2_50_32_9]|nr:MAG: DNA-binding response regulator [Flavobacteriales bacterium CG18_big_fil_WC_8_21_14_2_50_32_9]PJC62453.1 MAG: DNA-binding response regulator [Flavobacteriales bacterium CG_4_9_14_0_2_um_filter_32_27]
MFKAIIVDDEKGGRDNLEALLKSFPNISIIAKAGNIKEAQKALEIDKPDVLFLDIEMPGGNGFDLLEKLGNIDFDVIFTTAYDHYAIKAIKYSALDYLLKPIDPTDLEAAIKRFTNKLKDQPLTNTKLKTLFNNVSTESANQKIIIHDGEGLNFIRIKDIIRFHSEGSYTDIYIVGNQKPIFISRPINEYEDLLSNEAFYRIHRSHFINLQHVKKYVKGDGGYVIMSDNSKVEVARRKRNEFIQILSSSTF